MCFVVKDRKRWKVGWYPQGGDWASKAALSWLEKSKASMRMKKGLST